MGEPSDASISLSLSAPFRPSSSGRRSPTSFVDNDTNTTKPPLVANRSNTSQQKQHKNEVTCKFSPRPPFFERGFMPCPGAGAHKEAAADGRQPLPSATRRRLLTVLQRVL